MIWRFTYICYKAKDNNEKKVKTTSLKFPINDVTTDL